MGKGSVTGVEMTPIKKSIPHAGVSCNPRAPCSSLHSCTLGESPLGSSAGASLRPQPAIACITLGRGLVNLVCSQTVKFVTLYISGESPLLETMLQTRGNYNTTNYCPDVYYSCPRDVGTPDQPFSRCPIMMKLRSYSSYCYTF